MRNDNEYFMGIIVLILLAVVTGLGLYLAAYFEAWAYKHVTGKSVLTWDALFLDLRVQESPK